MSVARPSRCLFCTFKQASKTSNSTVRKRQFYASPTSSQRKSRNPVKPLSKEQIQSTYSPEQAEVIEQTQKQLGDTFKDFDNQTTANIKPWTMTYMQPMTSIDPVLDKAVKAPWKNIDDNSRLKTEDELNEDIMNFMQSMPDDEKAAEGALDKFLAENRLTVGKPEAESNVRSAIAPQSGRIEKEQLLPGQKPGEGTEVQKKKPQGRDKEGESRDQEVSPALVRLMQMTGLDQRQLASLRVKSIISHGVVNQTRLGKIRKQYWLSIAGNQNGLLGIGEGKSEESAEGMIQSQYRAIRNMVPVMRYENRTIFGDVEGKSGATELQLYTRPPGFGLRCQQYIYEMCRCAGISDLAARVTRARNPMNTVKAAFQAMQRQKDPEEIAKGRGKKLVDVRRVYYAGNV